MSSITQLGKASKESAGDSAVGIAGLFDVIQARGSVYKAIVGDIYQQGRVLARKYRYLRYSYLVFVSGFLISAAIFALELAGLLRG